MPISISGASRPKLATTVGLTVSVTAKNPVESDGDDTIQHRYVLEDVTPDAYTISGATWSTANGNVTVANNGAANVRVGDAIAGTGIPANTFVSAKASDSAFTLNNTPTIAGSASTLNATPPTFDATLLIMETKLSASGQALSPTLKVYVFDGTKAFDADRDGDDDAAIADAANFSKPLNSLNGAQIDLDTFLQNARKARTNS